MGCTSCATDNGLPKGCKSHGSCASGACNQMNTFDWLAEMPIAFGSQDGPEYFEISFNGGSRKEFFKNDNHVPVHTGDWVVVDTAMGFDIGQITLSGELVRLQMRKKKVKERNADFRNVLRTPSEAEFTTMKEAKALEQETMVLARAIARNLKLDMKVGQVEFQADKKKATFYYTAEDRVDFRDLIKEYAREFRVKVEMRQIGARQEAGKIGGIGSCGRELCCSTWLTDFKSVSTNAARYQNLSINLAKLSGQCGRLKCCLNYELDMYMEALQDFPKKADKLDTESGTVFLMKTDILKRLMWYTYAGDPTFYPLTVEQVAEIIELNDNGAKGKPLGQIAIVVVSEEEVEEEYEDTVGQISLSTLEKTGKKKKKRNKGKGGDRDGQPREGGQQREGGQPQNRGNQGGQRPQGERGPKPEGERPQGGGSRQGGQKPNNPNVQRSQGDRPPRNEQRGPRPPQGDKPQGDRTPREPREPRPPRNESREPRDGEGNSQGNRPPREPRPPRNEQAGGGNVPSNEQAGNPDGASPRPPREGGRNRGGRNRNRGGSNNSRNDNNPGGGGEPA
ncbi:hypothetical protein BH09BAC1_BH09BAC1_00670 [soil metagenome]